MKLELIIIILFMNMKAIESPDKLFLRLCDAAGTIELREIRNISMVQIMKAKEGLVHINSTVQVLEASLSYQSRN
jgi:hypothetical protein